MGQDAIYITPPHTSARTCLASSTLIMKSEAVSGVHSTMLISRTYSKLQTELATS